MISSALYVFRGIFIIPLSYITTAFLYIRLAQLALFFWRRGVGQLIPFVMDADDNTVIKYYKC